jgi:SAM-dependent methyltransferase
MTTSPIQIPDDEAIFYEKVASEQAVKLSQLTSIDQILDVERSISFQFLVKVAQSSHRERFPYPKHLWIAATFDCLSERDAYEYLAPLRGKKVLQIGGNGFAAILFLLAGASEGWLLTPVEGEARVAKELARLAGVEINCKVGVAEQIPFEDESFDAIHASGCAHHFQTEKAFPEIARILRKGGRFSATDPWRAPLYSWGIRTFGKREPVNCKPFTPQRVAPVRDSFRDYQIIQHGALTRYPLLALHKLGVSAPLGVSWNLTRLDDALCSVVGLRSFGSSVAILASK